MMVDFYFSRKDFFSCGHAFVTFPFFFNRNPVLPHFLQIVGIFPVFPRLRALHFMQMYIFLKTRAIASGNFAIKNTHYTDIVGQYL